MSKAYDNNCKQQLQQQLIQLLQRARLNWQLTCQFSSANNISYGIVQLQTSSLRQRWMFMGFSSSSSRALHRVLSRRSSRFKW